MNEDLFGSDILGMASQGFLNIGYTPELLRTDYSFTDILLAGDPLRTIELAVFAQDPPSYRNACFGISTLVGERDVAAQLRAYRALGAPQYLAFDPVNQAVQRWKMTAQGNPLFIEAISLEHLPTAFEQHRDDWNPAAMLRARAIRLSPQPIQMDLFDLGLLPLLEDETRRKLDELLCHVISSSLKLYTERHRLQPDYRAVFHLIFRLIAAKQLADRHHPGGNWTSSDPRVIIQAIQDFYFRDTSSEPVIGDREIQQAAWDQIRGAFSFANISVETLAYVYENTLVSEETRKQYDVHATPPEVAEFVVQSLPFEELALEERSVLEPFSGHAPFLTAALGRLRQLLPVSYPPEARHQYLVQMLMGMEIDAFAKEVARNSLILADYPNADGWQIVSDNVYTSPLFDPLLNRAGIVLCNPPYGDFETKDRPADPEAASNRAVEALRRILKRPPRLCGFVLPRAFIDGPKFQDARRVLANSYAQLQVVSLPRNAFQHSDVETVLVMGSGAGKSMDRLSASKVQALDYPEFLRTGKTSWQTEAPKGFQEKDRQMVLWFDPIQSVLGELAKLPRLGEVAEIHRGIEYNVPLKTNRDRLCLDHPAPGYSLGMMNTEKGFEPYLLRPSQYLAVSPELMRGNAYLRPWNQPKVIASAGRTLSEGWVLTAGVDHQGIVCYQRLHGIWPKEDIPLEILAAVLNGPVANAFLSASRTSRDNQIRNLVNVPIPRFSFAQRAALKALVEEYEIQRKEWLESGPDSPHRAQACREILDHIDAEVLTAYDLTPRQERKLLDYFAGLRRPGPVKFDRYYPPDFRPSVPWRIFISDKFRAAGIDETLRRLPIINDPDLATVLQDMEG
jgi:hypothetical protein